MNIFWSDLSKDYYLSILEQLFETWNIKIVELFEFETNSLIDRIVNHNHICPKSRLKNLHKCVINKQISLIYRIEKETLEIVTFIYNKSSHLY